MQFHEGDSVMHWTHGLGKVLRMETMTLSGEKTLYYDPDWRYDALGAGR